MFIMNLEFLARTIPRNILPYFNFKTARYLKAGAIRSLQMGALVIQCPVGKPFGQP